MIKCVIFDFNRTLYCPEKGVIIDGALDLLSDTTRLGIKLALVSAGNTNFENFKNKSFFSFFSIVKFVKQKDTLVFEETLRDLGFSSSEVVVVGDRIQSEIAAANALGIKTIWYQQGKYSREFPRSESEKPTWVVEKLYLVFEILKKINQPEITNSG
ncbi:HAD hydrolase-like protein [Candidatus Woesearchaeota archaeon]|nr:HAD hydrolase-like protein [Candidatus Woesearchaeota archaeon]